MEDVDEGTTAYLQQTGVRNADRWKKSYRQNLVGMYLDDLAGAVETSGREGLVLYVAALNNRSSHGILELRSVKRGNSLHLRHRGQERHEAHQTRYLELVRLRATIATGAPPEVQQVVHAYGP